MTYFFLVKLLMAGRVNDLNHVEKTVLGFKDDVPHHMSKAGFILTRREDLG